MRLKIQLEREKLKFWKAHQSYWKRCHKVFVEVSPNSSNKSVQLSETWSSNKLQSLWTTAFYMVMKFKILALWSQLQDKAQLLLKPHNHYLDISLLSDLHVTSQSNSKESWKRQSKHPWTWVLSVTEWVTLKMSFNDLIARVNCRHPHSEF